MDFSFAFGKKAPQKKVLFVIAICFARFAFCKLRISILRVYISPVTDVEIPVTCLRACPRQVRIKYNVQAGLSGCKALRLNTANFRRKRLGRTNTHDLLVKCMEGAGGPSDRRNSRSGFRYPPPWPSPRAGLVSHTPAAASRKRAALNHRWFSQLSPLMTDPQSQGRSSYHPSTSKPMNSVNASIRVAESHIP